MLRMVKGAVAKDMDAVKTFCEQTKSEASVGG